MIRKEFLIKLKKENKLKLNESSEHISYAYIIKSNNCMKVALLAFREQIYENAISEAYYSLYNLALSLFYRCGIKCENHSGAVLLIKYLFKLNALADFFFELKKDRIDNQYYTVSPNVIVNTKSSCYEKIQRVEQFNLELKHYIESLSLEDINLIRKDFDML